MLFAMSLFLLALSTLFFSRSSFSLCSFWSRNLDYFFRYITVLILGLLVDLDYFVIRYFLNYLTPEQISSNGLV